MVKEIKVEKSSVITLWFTLALVFAVAALAEFKIIDLTQQLTSIITILGSLFVLGEIGWFAALKKGNKVTTYIGLGIVAITIIGSILGLLNTGEAFNNVIAPIKGILDIALVIYIIVVAFTTRKQF